jgi:hypothetical protein
MERISPEQLHAIGEICRVFSRRLERGAGPGVIVTELIETFPEPSLVQKSILSELRHSLRKAGESENPKSVYQEILTVLCAWGDTMEEDEVLESLATISAEAGKR